MQPMSSHRIICDYCGAGVAPHEHYVVRIDVFADPSMPAVSSEELDEADFDWRFGRLLSQMKQMTADELQDDVHRRFEYRICRGCQKAILADPLGVSRRREQGGGPNA
jgi:hypothetical protein